MRENPDIQCIVDQMVNEKLKKKGKQQQQVESAGKMIKSPLDTTIYVPGLMQRVAIGSNQNKFETNVVNNQSTPKIGENTNSIPQQISKFIEGIRINPSEPVITGDTPNDRKLVVNERTVISDEQELEDLIRQARDMAGQKIIEAKKFKASLVPLPQGMVFNHAGVALQINVIESNVLNDESVPQVQVFLPSLINPKQAWQPDYDDNFFHITCHINPSLRSKIEKGEFIELDKLLPKDKYAAKGEDQMDPLRQIHFLHGCREI